MSIKDIFQKGHNKVLSQTQVDKYKKDLESEELVRNFLKRKKRIADHVDYSDPSKFSVYGSAEKYYQDSIERIYKTYPYDGSLSEKMAWHNESSDLDIWILENIYPKASGSVRLGSGQSIVAKGGPRNTPEVSEGERSELAKQYPERGGRSNIWNSALYRNSNIYIDSSLGNTIEFWCKVDQSIIDNSETIIPVTIGNDGGIKIQISYNFNTENLSLAYLDDNGNGMGYDADAQVNIPGFFSNEWNQYSFSLKNGETNLIAKIYKNGEEVARIDSANNPNTSPVSQLDSFLVINGQRVKIAWNINSTVDGLHIDEFRFWKTSRNSEEIGRYWFTNISGGTNTDDHKYRLDNKLVDIGIYYKFNEGFVGDENTDERVLDYSGRIANGYITSYTSDVRAEDIAGTLTNRSSALQDSDPIIYSHHPSVKSVLEEYTIKGRSHDHLNNAGIYHSMPGWIIDEDAEFGNNILDLTQVISSYFDSAQVQISRMTELHAADYHSLENTNDAPYPLIRNALENKGLLVPDLFAEATAFEEILSRGEQYKFEKKIEDIKNLIYQNIYNNLTYIYKSKGTEKSFRNLLRCFGIDDEVIKINIYADEQDLNLESNFKNTASRKKFIDFNNEARESGIVYTKSNPQEAGTYSYISGMPQAKNSSLSFTLETEVIFPNTKSVKDDPNYYGYTNPVEPIAYIGEYDASNDAYTSNEILNIKAVKVNNDNNSENVNIVLSCAGVTVQTDVLRSVFDNKRFNIAARLVPKDKVLSLVQGGGQCDYDLELYCVSSWGGNVEYEDFKSATVARADAISILKKNKFVSVGSFRDSNLPESPTLADATRLKMSSVLFWYDNVTNDEVKEHSLDILSFGRMYPNENAYVLDADINGEVQVPRRDTLALHWDFGDVETTDANGDFTVIDLSEDIEAGRYGWFTDLVKNSISGKGTHFAANDSQVVNREYLHSAKQRLPESVNPEDLIQIRTFDDEVYKKDPDIVRYFFSIEKSMYQVINDDIINFFASIKEFNNLIGQPVNRYRMQYKSLEKFRNRYFERVKNIPNVEKYVEIFKWLDTSIGMMLYQLIPASSAFSAGLRTMIESHILERNKYWNKFPTLEMSSEPPLGIVKGINELTYNWKDGSAPISLIPPQVALTVGSEASHIDIGDSSDLEFGDGTTDSAFSISSFVFVPQNYQDEARRIQIVSKEGEYELELLIHKHDAQYGDRVGLYFNLFDDSIYDAVTLGPEGRLTVGRSTVFKKGEWHHITVTYDGSSTLDGIQIYTDAVKRTTNIYRLESQTSPYVAMEPTNGSFYIGRPKTDDTTANQEAYFSNVAIFNTELGIEQISELYKNHDSSAYTNAVARWQLNGVATDSIGSLNGTLEGDIVYADNPAYQNHFLWFDKRVNGDDSNISTNNTDIDNNREIIRRISTRSTEGNTRVVERNGVFVQEDKPLIRKDDGTVYEAQAYVNRALAKPYKLNLNISKNIHGGVNYSPTTKDPNAFIRASTRFIPGTALSSVSIELENNPVTYEEWKKLYKVKRSVSIIITDTELSTIQTYDGDLIYPYYGRNYIDPSPVITGLHNDSYGDDAEIPAQGPFTETWVGGNQHRHIDFTVQTGRAELYVNDNGALKHPQEVSPTAPSARYTREEVAKRPINVKNIKTGETRLLGNYSRDYQVVQTSGRTQNNRWFVDLSEEERSALGIVDYTDGYSEFSSGDFIRVSDDSSLSFVNQPNDDLDSPFTFSAWVKFSAKTGSPDIFTKSGEYKLEWTQSFGLTLYLYGASAVFNDGTFDPDIGTWYHIAVTYNGQWNLDSSAAVNFYVNSLKATETVGGGTHDEMIDKSFDLIIGSTFQGQMKSVAIFDKELNQQEIDSIYENIDLEKSLVYSDLISWWKLYLGDAQDSISTNHGTASGVEFEVINSRIGAFINRIPFISGSIQNQNNYYPKVYSEDYTLPDRQRSEHVFTERFSAPGDPLTLSPVFMDPIAEEYSVYNSMNFRNLEERTKWQEELYTHSDKYRGSNGYKYSSPQLPIASVHKINRNTNVRPTNIQHDNAYISHQIPRSNLQYTFARNTAKDYDYVSDFSSRPNHTLPQDWITNQSDERTTSFAGVARVQVPDSNIVNFASSDFTISIFLGQMGSSTAMVFHHTGYFLANVAGNLRAVITDSNGNDIQIQNATAIDDNELHNVVIRYQQAATGDKFKMFIDGVENYSALSASGTYALPNAQDGTGLSIGAAKNGTLVFGGMVKDLVVVPRALTDAEILELTQERSPSLHSAYPEFSAWWKLGGELDEATGTDSMKDYIGSLHGTVNSTVQGEGVEFVNATVGGNSPRTGPRVRWNSSNTSHRILSLIGEEKDHHTEVADAPIASGMYRWVSPTTTWSSPIRLCYRVIEGSSGGEYGLVDKPEKDDNEHLWLQYKVGASGSWETLTQIESEHPVPISGRKYEIEIYQGQDYNNRLHLRWISRGPEGDTGEDAGTHDHDHWGIYDVVVQNLPPSQYYSEVDTRKGGEGYSAPYSDYQGAGYRFLRNIENTQVWNQRKKNTFSNVLRSDESLSRTYIEPPVQWNKPTKHLILTEDAHSQLIREAADRDVLIGGRDISSFQQFIYEIMYRAKHLQGNSNRISQGITHSYINNLEMFSHDEFNNDIDLENSNPQFLQTLNELIRRGELLYSTSYFKEIIMPSHKMVGRDIVRDRTKFDTYKVFWRDKFFDRIKCVNETKLGYKLNKEFIKMFKQKYSVDVMDNFYHIFSSGNTHYPFIPLPQGGYGDGIITTTAEIEFSRGVMLNAQSGFNFKEHSLTLEGGVTGNSVTYRFSNVPEENGTVNSEQEVLLFIGNDGFTDGEGTAPYLAAAINLRQSTDFSATSEGMKTIITNKATGLNTALPIRYSSLFASLIYDGRLSISQFQGGHVEQMRVIGDLSYIGKDRMQHLITRRDSPVADAPTSSPLVPFSFLDSSCSVFSGDELVVTYGDESIRHNRHPIPTPQLYHNPDSRNYRESSGWINMKTSRDYQLDIYGDFSKISMPNYDSYEKFSEEIRLAGQNYSIIPEYRISEHVDYHLNERRGDWNALNYHYLTIDGASYDEVEHTRTSGLGGDTTIEFYSVSEPEEFPYRMIDDYSELINFNCAGGEFRNHNQISSPPRSNFNLDNSIETATVIDVTEGVLDYIGRKPIIEGINHAGSFNLVSNEDDFLKVEFDRTGFNDFEPLQIGTKPTAVSIWAQHDISNWSSASKTKKYIEQTSFGLWSISDGANSINLFSNYYWANPATISKRNFGITLAWDSSNPAINDSMPEQTPTITTDSTIYTFFHKNGERAYIDPYKMNNIIVQFVPSEARELADRDTTLNFAVKIWLNSEELYGVHINEFSQAYNPKRTTNIVIYEDNYNDSTTGQTPTGCLATSGVLIAENVNDSSDKIVAFKEGDDTLLDGDYPNSSGTDIGLYRWLEIDEDITESVYLSFKPHEGHPGNPYGLSNAPESADEEHLWVQYKRGNGSWENAVQIESKTSVNGTSNRWDGEDEVRVHLAHGQSVQSPLRIRFISLTTNQAIHDHWGVDDVKIVRPKQGIRGFSPVPMGDFNPQIPNLATFFEPWNEDYDTNWSAMSSQNGIRGLSQSDRMYIGNCDSFNNQQVDHTSAKANKFIGYLDELSVFSEMILGQSGVNKIYNSGSPSNVLEINVNSQDKNDFGSTEKYDYDIGSFYVENFQGVDNNTQPLDWTFNSPTGPVVLERNTPIEISYPGTGIKAISMSGTSSSTLTAGSYPNTTGLDAGTYRYAELEKPFYSPITVSFNVQEGLVGYNGEFLGLKSEPDPNKEEHLWVQYKVGAAGDWINAHEVVPAAGSNKIDHRIFGEPQTFSIGDVGQSNDNPLYLRWISMLDDQTEQTAVQWAFTNVKVLSTDRVIELEEIAPSDGTLGNSNFGLPFFSRGASFLEKNYSAESLNSLKNNLIAWHRIGIPKYEKPVPRQPAWDKEFLNTYALSDTMNYIQDLSEQNDRISQYRTENVLKLRVNTVKKLLPYEGFYPQDRTVQIADLFVQKIEKDITPSSRWYRNGEQHYKEQAIQAALQHFFAPGILYNSLKAGLACDWASYTNITGMEPSYFGEKIPVFPAAGVGADRVEYKYSKSLTPSWYSSYAHLATYFNADITENHLVRLQDDYPDLESNIQGLDIYPYQTPGAIAQANYNSSNEIISYTISNATVDEMVILGDPSIRLPFDAILNPYEYIKSQEPEFYTPQVGETSASFQVQRNPRQFYLMAPSYYKNYVSTTLTNNDPAQPFPPYEMSQISGDYEKYSFPYFEIKQESRRDNRYEAAINNFLAESVRFFLKGNNASEPGSLNSFRSLREDEFRDFKPGNVYKLNITLRKDVKCLLAQTPHTANYGGTQRQQSVNGGRYFGPPTLWFFDPSKIESTEREYAHREPAFGPYVPSYFYGEATAVISFLATQSRHTIDEIQSTATVEDASPAALEYFKAMAQEIAQRDSEGTLVDERQLNLRLVETFPAYRNRMPVSASVDLFGKARSFVRELNSDGSERASEQPGTSLNTWVISTRYECPMFNFGNPGRLSLDSGELSKRGITDDFKEELELNTDGDIITHYASYMNKFNFNFENVDKVTGGGLWSALGDGFESKVTISLEDPYFPENSLAYVCGFETQTKRIGESANERLIKEAVVMIPVIDDDIGAYSEWTYDYNGFTVIRLPTYEEQRDKYDTGNMIYRRNVIQKDSVNYSIEDERVFETSVTDLVRKMREYVIPPRFDFEKNDNIKPFAMYIHEFEHILEDEDIRNIWQGVPPELARRATLDSSVIEHEIGPYEILDDSVLGLATDFMGQLASKIKWLTFKVKKRAEINYINVVENENKENTFQYFRNNRLETPEYGYNYPYDYFTMIDRVQVEAELCSRPVYDYYADAGIRGIPGADEE